MPCIIFVLNEERKNQVTCVNYRVINLLSISSWGMMGEVTHIEDQLGNEQCRFKRGRGYMAFRVISEKCLREKNYLFAAYFSK